jgi:hypothetical protein
MVRSSLNLRGSEEHAVPGKLIVHGNTAATVNNIAAHEMLFRFGIAGKLISQAAFIFVAFALYKLLAGVDRQHASLINRN